MTPHQQPSKSLHKNPGRQSKIIQFLMILLLIMTNVKFANAEVIYSIKLIGLTGHLKKNQNPHLYRIKFDKKGKMVINLGLVLSAEYFIYKEVLSIKFAQAFMLDCAFLPSGFTHLGLRLCAHSGRHTFTIGNGPTLFYRQDWRNLPAYHDEGLLKRSGNMQYRFFWYAGEVEYDYALSGKPDLSISLIPGPPVFFTIAPGIRLK